MALRRQCRGIRPCAQGLACGRTMLAPDRFLTLAGAKVCRLRRSRASMVLLQSGEFAMYTMRRRVHGAVRRFACTALLIVSSPTLAQGYVEHPQILNLQAAGVEGEAVILLGELSIKYGKGDLPKMQEELRQHRRQLDEAATSAVKFAGKDAALVEAINEYYVAASTYLDAGMPRSAADEINSQRLHSEMETKSTALDREAKRAGTRGVP